MEILILAAICYFGAKLLFSSNKKEEARKNQRFTQNHSYDDEALDNLGRVNSSRSNNHDFAKGVGTGILGYMVVDSLLDKQREEQADSHNATDSSLDHTSHVEALDHEELDYNDDYLNDSMDSNDSFDDFDGFDDF